MSISFPFSIYRDDALLFLNCRMRDDETDRQTHTHKHTHTHAHTLETAPLILAQVLPKQIANRDKLVMYLERNVIFRSSRLLTVTFFVCISRTLLETDPIFFLVNIQTTPFRKALPQCSSEKHATPASCPLVPCKSYIYSNTSNF